MIITEKPYFLENEEWYTINEGEGRGYLLTDKAPKKAVESYNKFYKELELNDRFRAALGLKKKKGE